MTDCCILVVLSLLSIVVHDVKAEKRLVLHSDDDIIALIHTLSAEVQSLKSTTTTLNVQLANQTALVQQLQNTIQQIQTTQGHGSTYVRWGRRVCNANGTELVYKGYTGGSWYAYPGGAANYVCLTDEPLWGAYDDTAQTYSGKMYGTEYEFGEEFGDGGTKFFGQNLYEHDVPCAVCRSSRPTSVMIPGRNKCYPGWTQEYAGYLVSGRSGPTYDKSSTEYVCLDAKPEVEAGDRVNENGKLMILVEGICGSLKCPPYKQYRELTCVVCSK